MDKIQIIEKLFFYIEETVAPSYLLIPLIALLTWKKTKGKITTVLAIYGVLFCTLTFIYNDIPKDLKKYYQALYTFLEYFFFVFIFWSNIENKKAKKTIFLLSVVFFLFQCIYTLKTKLVRLDSIPIGIETILILSYIFYFFYESAKKTTTSYIYNHYCFWLSVGILIYLGGSFFFYILINYLNQSQINTFGNLIYLTEIFKNILFSVAIFVYARYPLEKIKKRVAAVPYLDMI